MTGYIYNTDSREVVATLTSSNQALIESTADALGVDTETYSLTYSPAFGANDGLIDTDAPNHDLDAMAPHYLVYTADGTEVGDFESERDAERAAEARDKKFNHSAEDGDLCRVELFSIAEQISL